MLSGKIIKLVCQLFFCPQNSINLEKGTQIDKIGETSWVRAIPSKETVKTKCTNI